MQNLPLLSLVPPPGPARPDTVVGADTDSREAKTGVVNWRGGGGGGADSSGFSVKLVDSVAIREAAGGSGSDLASPWAASVAASA